MLNVGTIGAIRRVAIAPSMAGRRLYISLSYAFDAVKHQTAISVAENSLKTAVIKSASRKPARQTFSGLNVLTGDQPAKVG